MEYSLIVNFNIYQKLTIISAISSQIFVTGSKLGVLKFDYSAKVCKAATINLIGYSASYFLD